MVDDAGDPQPGQGLQFDVAELRFRVAVDQDEVGASQCPEAGALALSEAALPVREVESADWRLARRARFEELERALSDKPGQIEPSVEGLRVESLPDRTPRHHPDVRP